jgi:hypothetical protein
VYNIIGAQYDVMADQISKAVLKSITTHERQFLLRLQEFQEAAGLYLPEK